MNEHNVKELTFESGLVAELDDFDKSVKIKTLRDDLDKAKEYALKRDLDTRFDDVFEHVDVGDELSINIPVPKPKVESLYILKITWTGPINVIQFHTGEWLIIHMGSPEHGPYLHSASNDRLRVADFDLLRLMMSEKGTSVLINRSGE